MKLSLCSDLERLKEKQIMSDSTRIWTLLGVVVGGVLQHVFWRIQRREMSRVMEQRDRQREQNLTAERIQSLGTQTIELASSPFSGPHISHTEVTTQTYVELLRLQREFRAIIRSSGELFSDQRHQQLENFRSRLSQVALRNPPQQEVDSLCTELKNLYSDLRKEISKP
jgi:hypothetical protein